MLLMVNLTFSFQVDMERPLFMIQSIPDGWTQALPSFSLNMLFCSEISHVEKLKWVVNAGFSDLRTIYMSFQACIILLFLREGLK